MKLAIKLYGQVLTILIHNINLFSGKTDCTIIIFRLYKIKNVYMYTINIYLRPKKNQLERKFEPQRYFELNVMFIV